jgi:signal transduction histidine kinase
MGTHGAAGTRPPALPPGNRSVESANANSARRHPRLNLSDWPVSRRLFAVIVAALLMGVIFGGLRVADAEASASQFSKTSQFANLSEQLVILVNDLQNERDLTLTDLATDSRPPRALQALFAKTEAEALAVRSAAAPIGSGFPANIQADVATVLADISPDRILQLHETINPSLPANELAAIANYGVVISDIINLADQVSQGVSDASLASDVRALNALSLAKEQVSQQRALLNDAITNPNDLTNTLTALPISQAEEAADESIFQGSATPSEQTFLTDALGAPGESMQIAMAQNIESNVLAGGDSSTVLADLQTLQADLLGAQAAVPLKGLKFFPSLTPEATGTLLPGATLTSAGGLSDSASPQQQLQAGLTAWDKGTGDELDAMQATERQIASSIVARADQLQSAAGQSALLYAVITALVLLLVLAAAVAVARSLVLPLRRLRAGALDIASVQLPERVRLLSESPESTATMEVAPIDVVSEDEIGQVARAFDQVHSEAVRLAGEQALLRSSFNAMFVNLSRRSQSLIERLARTIDTLEQSEDDPDRLGSLFAMDHMVTRMRRNSENLLLLAGHENPRKWSESIPLADVARAATSEIEQYNRVTLNIPPGIAVIGQAVSDVVHLLAELVENATIFSPKDTTVTLTMQELTSGGVLIEILDKGIGVSEARLTDMNFRLDNPPTIDVSVSRHMGLFAVARLAERHRVRVRLRPASPQGLSALVWLPDSVIERTGRYSSVQSWSTQTAGSPAVVGTRPGTALGNGADAAFDEDNGALAPSGYAGAGAGNGYAGAGAGNGYAGHGGGGNGFGTGGVNGGSVGNGAASGGNGFSGASGFSNGNGFSNGTGNGFNGSGNGNGFGSAANGSGANGHGSGSAAPAGREARTASGWFRGPLTGATPASGPAAGSGGGPVPFGGSAASDRTVRRVPGESLAGSPFAEQTAAGLPVRSPRGSGATPAAASADPAAPDTGVSPAGSGSQPLPVRGSDPGRATPSRGPVPRGPGGGTHALPQRSPDQARSRLAGFQRGTRRAEENQGSDQSGMSGQLGQASGAEEGSER